MQPLLNGESKKGRKHRTRRILIWRNKDNIKKDDKE